MGSREDILSGWGGYPKARTEVVRPEAVTQLPGAFTGVGHVIPRGLGRSYGDAAFAGDGRTVLTGRLDRILELDEDAGEIEVEAGLRLDALIRFLVPRGLFPAVVPGTSQVTLGGLVACDVHGKNHHVAGATSRHVLQLGLVLPSGERVTVSRTEDPELFWATLGGMGLTGIVERVRLKLERIESAYFSVDIDRTANFEEALDRFHDSDDQYTHSVAWIDALARGRHLGRGVLLRGNWLPAAGLEGRRARDPLKVVRRPTAAVPLTPPSGLLNTASITAFNTAFYLKNPKRARGHVEDYDKYFFPLDIVHDWNRLYGPRGFLQYQLVIPEDGGREGLREILETSAEAHVPSFLSVLKRFGPEEADQLLSFPMAGYTYTLDIPMAGEETLDAPRALRPHGPRPRGPALPRQGRAHERPRPSAPCTRAGSGSWR